MLISFTFSLFFNFLIVNARLDHSEALSKGWSFMKGADVIPSTSNAVSHHLLTKGSTSDNLTAQENAPAALPPIQDAGGDNNITSTPTSYPEPLQNQTSTCIGPSGKPVIFTDRDCWHAAKAMAGDRASMSQCGSCVLGLYDVDNKKTFKPAGSLNVTFLQAQAMNLLNQCKSKAQKVTKRDSSPTKSPDGGTNVELLMGYKAEAKPCAGL